MKKMKFVRIITFLLSLLMLCGAVSSCARSGSDPEDPSDLTDSEQDPEISSEDEEDSKISVRYGIINGQAQMLTENKYNENGQILSVTALDLSTLAPMYYETYKMDKVYRYDEAGKMTSVWISFGTLFELVYQETNASVAVGTIESDGEVAEARMTFNDKNILLKEEYSIADQTIVFEYDDLGNIVKETRSTGWSVEHHYAEGSVLVDVLKDGETSVRYTLAYNDHGKISKITGGSTFLQYRYDDEGRCVISQTGESVTDLTYENGKLSRAETYRDESSKMETFVYDEDGVLTQYTRRRIVQTEAIYSNTEDIYVYSYDKNDLIKGILCTYIEYDKEDKEISRRTEAV